METATPQRKDRDHPHHPSFFGIYTRMYFADHAPPHIHVECQGHEALIAIADGSLIEGELPRRAIANGASTIAPSWSRIGRERRPCSR